MIDYNKIWDEITQDANQLREFSIKARAFINIETSLIDLVGSIKDGSIGYQDYIAMCQAWAKIKTNVSPFA